MSRMSLAFLFLTTILLRYGIAQENMKRTITLKECEELALSNNLTIQDAKLGVEFSKARLTQASHAKILPKFQLRNIWGPIPPARALFTETGVLHHRIRLLVFQIWAILLTLILVLYSRFLHSVS